MERIRILLLEDSALDAELAQTRLARAGLNFGMDRVETREAFVAALETVPYDLILADYSLPMFDGLSALEIASGLCPQVPFLLVSGGLGEEVAIDSLKRGATDYVLKHRIDRLAPAVTRALAESRERADRRRAEAALRQSEERHRLILESVKDYAIFTLDLDGRVSSWNKGAEGVLGYREPEIVGRPVAVIFTPEDVERGAHEAELTHAAVRGRSEDERWHVRQDGSRFWAGGAVRPLLDEVGALRGYVKVMHDMTERKRAEEALREADRRKDDFLAMLAHELRNPLSAINNAIQLARRSVKAEHLEWAKDVIGQQVKHLARLIDDLLDVSRITRGKIQLRPGPHDPAAIIRGAVDAVHPIVEARGHQLSVKIAPGILRVEADATRLEQVLVNLLTNAAKYTEEAGRIVLDARTEGGELVIRVRDNGIGIEPEMLPRIFEPFVQAEQSIDRSQGGLGVGLTLARKLVEMHGGTLTATSPGLGQGSELTVRLPLSDDPTHATGLDQISATVPVMGPRVLIVDDNVESAKGLATLLQMVGYDPQTAFDGRSALEAALIDRPEIVLLDIGLPGMDGYELASTLRRDRRLEDALLIAITGYGQDEDRRRSAEAGFDHYLVKPVDIDALLDLLARPDKA